MNRYTMVVIAGALLLIALVLLTDGDDAARIGSVLKLYGR